MTDKQEPARSGKPAAPPTILVVDDSQDIRDLFNTALQRGGYKVLSAVDGESALQIFQQHRGAIRLVIIDVVMPGMSGLKLAPKLLNLRADLKLLFISAFVPEATLRGQLRPEDKFLAKPIPPERLITTVQEMLAA